MRSEERAEDEAAAAVETGWRERLWALGAAAGRLFETRTEILQEELAEKGIQLGRALAGLFLALLFATLAGLLLTALLAAVLAKLLGGPVLGILATLVLYLAVAGTLGWLAVKKLSLVRPFEFPMTRREIHRDLDAIKDAAGVGRPRDEGDESGESPGRGFERVGSRESPEEMEARLREGAG